eukprot:2449344-Lingulodinium_polyedra.AAC.1
MSLPFRSPPRNSGGPPVKAPPSYVVAPLREPEPSACEICGELKEIRTRPVCILCDTLRDTLQILAD